MPPASRGALLYIFVVPHSPLHVGMLRVHLDSRERHFLDKIRAPLKLEGFRIGDVSDCIVLYYYFLFLVWKGLWLHGPCTCVQQYVFILLVIVCRWLGPHMFI